MFNDIFEKYIALNVAIMEIGIAVPIIIDILKLCRNKNNTSIARMPPSSAL